MKRNGKGLAFVSMKVYLNDDNFLSWAATQFRWWPSPYTKFILSSISQSIATCASNTLHSHKVQVRTWRNMCWASGVDPPENAALQDLIN
eukprot:13612365-Heterocapsa_arctica.AAC.3